MIRQPGLCTLRTSTDVPPCLKLIHRGLSIGKLISYRASPEIAQGGFGIIE
jgi:hypothetical protein